MLYEIFATAADALPTKANRLYKAIVADIHSTNKDGVPDYPSVEKVKSLVAKGVKINAGLGDRKMKFGPFQMEVTGYPTPLELVAAQYIYISQYLRPCISAQTNSRKSKRSENGKYYEPVVSRPVTDDELREYLSRLREITQVLIDAGANPHGAIQKIAKMIEARDPGKDRIDPLRYGREKFAQPEMIDYLAQLEAPKQTYNRATFKSSKKGPQPG